MFTIPCFQVRFKECICMVGKETYILFKISLLQFQQRRKGDSYAVILIFTRNKLVYNIRYIQFNTFIAYSKALSYTSSSKVLPSLRSSKSFKKLPQFLTEIKANDVKLQSFDPKEELNPKIWVDDKLNPKIRLRLLNISDDFVEFLNVKWVKPSDIQLTGSLANYNWSHFSDMDIHIKMDFSKVYEKKEFVEEYFKMKKNEWNEEHDKLKIYGYRVEFFVEDVDYNANSNGIYSIEDNKWIHHPNELKNVEIDKNYIKSMSAKFMTEIETLLMKTEKEKKVEKLEAVFDKSEKLLNKLKRMRKNGLKKGGEMSSENIVYKVLRRTGYLEKLWKLNSELKGDIYSKKYSL
ncbi:MAG: hypothetical protein EZS28_031853 [Streblomastix strix]|uniref:Uncharacterized protein n=1 Tax=Streblomastix strix TaxID=222440 RepID=A0A5J4UQ59_9EUKA|nr:MAG: hypothetical protein EZS28_031853 [Streblomastix strix]